MVERRLKRWYKKELGKTSDYGILAWGSANKINLKAIERTMNKAIRLIGFKRKYDSVKWLFDYYCLLKLENMIKINKGKFMWKLVNKEQSGMYLNEGSPSGSQCFK